MKKIVVVALMLTALWAGTVFSAVPPELVEVRGTVERWFAADQTILVAGKRYRLAEGVEILDGSGNSLDRSALRPGVRVLLIESEGEVESVVINPRAGSSANRPLAR